LGILALGTPPGSQEVVRILRFLVITILYGVIWLALALVCSVVFHQSATAALASIAVWLFITVFWGIMVGLLAQFISLVRSGLLEELLRQAQVQRILTGLSPNALDAEATLVMLQPNVRSLGIFLPTHLEGAVYWAPLPSGQIVLLIWPHLTGMIASTILLFALAYILFQRQELQA
jgi:ABC-2 type transport system permease protein